MENLTATDIFKRREESYKQRSENTAASKAINKIADHLLKVIAESNAIVLVKR